ncbi:MAG: adenosylcobinamide-phosphate synthase CbiB [Cyanobacteria bacterium J06626_18]
MPALWCSLPVAVPTLAALTDFMIGDPWQWLHPVQVMGWVIQAYQSITLQLCKSPSLQRLTGVGLGLGLPLLSGAIAGGTVQLAWQLSPWVGFMVAVVTLASCFAGRSLRRAAEDVLEPLTQGDRPKARQRLSLYVGRDTQALSDPEILRAVMETISENATDGVLAPLFYALIGLAIAPAVGVGLAIAYKALSTLDSMVGYRQAPYTYLGWFSARSEDVATWLPCRLAVFTIALWSQRPSYVWQVCRRDAPADPSPNAGWSECAYAAALGVQLGGLNTYQGQIRKKPQLGDPTHPIHPQTIHQGLQLTRRAFLSWLTVGVVGLICRYGLHCG